MTTTMPVLDRNRATVLPALQAAIARLDPGCRLPASYHLGWCDNLGNPTVSAGGKALRPTLAMLSVEAVGAPAATGVPGAVAVELVHNFSLLHDDLLDGDTERRHRRTVWAVWGAATAILTGDALLALAHETLLESDAPGRAEAALLLAVTTRELTRGQVQDLAFESRNDVMLAECLDMAVGKTAALLSASTAIGAVLAGAADAQVGALSAFGSHLGVAFQLVDDVLGVWGDPAVTGKPVYSDLRSRKKTLPVTWALTHPRVGARLREFLDDTGEASPPVLEEIAEVLIEAGARDWALAEARRRLGLAEQSLAIADLDPAAREDLSALARYVVERDS